MIDSVVGQGCIIPPWLFNLHIGAEKKECENEDGEEREWRRPGLLYADNLVFCNESEEDLKKKGKRPESQCI